MSMTPNESNKGSKRGREYTRYTEEQIEALEKFYGECKYPNLSQRAAFLLEQSILTGLEDNQIKTWFQNRRSRDKQKKGSGELLREKEKLAHANSILTVENDHLHDKVAELHNDNDYLLTHFMTLTASASTNANVTANAIVAATANPTAMTTAATTADLGLVPEAESAPLAMMSADNDGLLFLAEETKNEFLSKANGTSINWKPIITLKVPSPSSAGAIYVPETCIGVAARACTMIPFEPIKLIQILKDRPSWSRNCRNQDVLAQYPSPNGGTIELIYTKYYAPTTMACARDFWTLRYTLVLNDGSVVVCEKSISGSDAVPSLPAALEFVRGTMMASGYLIRRCEGGSLLTLIEHLDLEPSSVPVVIRPLYESSELVAEKLISSAIRYIETMDTEKNDKRKYASGEGPAAWRSFSQRLSRSFNDAISGFTEDGWTRMNAYMSDDVIMSFKRIETCGQNTSYDSAICVKASFLLKSVIPAKLMMRMKEHRSSWMDFNFADHYAADSGESNFPFPGTNTHNFSEAAVPLGNTNYEDEVLEVIRFNCFSRYKNGASSGDLYHLQISNGMNEETGIGACSELIFASIHRSLPNDAILLSSGIRVVLLGSNTSNGQGTWSSSNASHVCGPSSMVTLAFQFPYKAHLQASVALMAQKYIQHVSSSVKNISLEMRLTGSYPASTPVSTLAATNSIRRSSSMGPTIPTGPLYDAMNSKGKGPAMEPIIRTDSIFAAMNSIGGSSSMVHTIPTNSFYAAMNSTEKSLATGPVIIADSSFAAINSKGKSPVMGPEITVDSIFTAMNSKGKSPAMGLEITTDSIFAAMDSTGGDLTMGPEITQDELFAAMDFTEECPPMGPEITQDSIFDAIEESQAMWPDIIPDVTYAAMNFIEESPAKWPEITPGATCAAINFTEENPAIGPVIAPGGTYAAVQPAETNTSMGPAIPPDSSYDVTLANLICESYRSKLGMEIPGFNSQNNYSVFELIKNHPYAIVCFSFSSVPVCMYANQAGLRMIETTRDNLKSFPVDKIIFGCNYASLSSLLPTVMQQGYAIFPPGFCMSEMDNGVSYEQAVVWKVEGPDRSVICLAFAFNDWSFLHEM